MTISIRHPLCLAVAFLGLALATPATAATYVIEMIALGTGNFDRVGGDDTVHDATIAINSVGAVSFIGQKSTPQVTTYGVYFGSGGALTTVATETTTVEGGNVVRRELYAPQINAGGVLAWLRYTQAEGSSIHRGTAGDDTLLASGTVSNPSIDDNGLVYYFRSVSGGAHGIFARTNSTQTGIPIATSAVTYGGPYNVVRAPYTISRNGNVAYHAYFGSDPETEGIFAYVNGTTSTVADSNGAFDSFEDGPAINNNGDVAFVGTLKTADVATGATTGIFLKRAGQSTALIVPEMATDKHDLSGLSLATDGTLTFTATVSNTRQGLFVRHPDGSIDQVASTADIFSGKKANYIYGSRQGLNEAGQIAFMVYREDFSYGIFRASIAAPGTVPVAQDDTVPIRGAGKIDVLANDTPATNFTLKISAVGKPAKGKASIAGGLISYTPGATFDGTDSFTYTVTSNGFTDSATVTVTNPLLPLAGTYFQLLTDNAVASGTLLATLSSSGAVKGKIVLGGKTYPLKGTADLTGLFTQTFKRSPAGTPDLVLTLQFASSSNIAKVSGQITGDVTTHVIASTAVGLAALPAGIQAGAYTIELPPDADTSHPRGTGYATATLSSKGLLRLGGKLADGTPFTASGALNTDQKVALSVSLNTKPKGSLTGTLTFAASPSRCTGTLTWLKPAPTKPTTLFPAGFTATTAADGALYTLPANAPTLTYTTPQADLHLRGGGLPDADPVLNVTSADKLTAASPDTFQVKATIARKSGLFTGSFVPTGATKAVKFQGILHQTKNHAAGFFLGTNQSGSVELVPH